MKVLTVGLFLLAVSLLNSGCSVYMAFTLPPPVPTPSLGWSRMEVIERLGEPALSTEKDDGSREDVFSYCQISPEAYQDKDVRGTGNLLMDIVSLGVWEMFATPSEIGMRCNTTWATVDFDKTEELTSITVQ
ncbi:MAG TPA: hypothetical protein VEI50_06465 [Nitrospiraceae bacterium]|nr:hypothetical protein [Nitrospiraceae bacterium]